MVHAIVAIGDMSYTATETEPVTFGRDSKCTICLDFEDTGISRLAGTVQWNNATWWLMNCSQTRSLLVADAHIPRNVLPPRYRRHPIDIATRVIVEGQRGQHVLTVTPHASAHPCPPDDAEPPGMATVSGIGVKISLEDRLALAALLENYVNNPARTENIRSYEAAAARLGWSRDQVRRRIDYLRQKLSTAGVPRLDGANALYHLAEHVIVRGLLTEEDLRRLPPRS